MIGLPLWLLIPLCFLIYLAGIYALVYFFGWKSGKKRLVRARYDEMSTSELLAAWSFAWPLAAPAAAIVTPFVGIYALAGLGITIFKSAHEKGLAVTDRKTDPCLEKKVEIFNKDDEIDLVTTRRYGLSAASFLSDNGNDHGSVGVSRRRSHDGGPG